MNYLGSKLTNLFGSKKTSLPDNNNTADEIEGHPTPEIKTEILDSVSNKTLFDNINNTFNYNLSMDNKNDAFSKDTPGETVEFNNINVNDVIAFRSTNRKSDFITEFGIFKRTYDNPPNDKVMELYIIKFKLNGASAIVTTERDDNKIITLTKDANDEIFANNNTKDYNNVTDYKVIGTWEPSNTGGKRRTKKHRVVSKRRHRKSSLLKKRSIKRKTRR